MYSCWYSTVGNSCLFKFLVKNVFIVLGLWKELLLSPLVTCTNFWSIFYSSGVISLNGVVSLECYFVSDALVLVMPNDVGCSM